MTSIVLFDRAVVVLENQPLIVAQREIRLGKAGGEGHGLLRGLARALSERGSRGAVDIQARGSPRDPSPRLRETRIEGHGLLVEAECPPHAGRVADSQASPDLLTLQKRVVGGEVLRRLL